MRALRQEVCGRIKKRARRAEWLEHAAYKAMEAGPQAHAKGLEGHTEPERGPLKLIHSGMVSILHTPGTGIRSVDMATL